MNDNIQNTEIKELLQSYVKNTFQFSKSDPLANVNAHGILSLSTQPIILDASWEKLYKSVKNSQKEFGINPLCISQGVLSLRWKEIDYQIPIFLQQVKIQIDKLSREILLENIDEPELNPFIFWFFEREFNIILSQSFDELKNQLSEYSVVQIDENSQFIGNFHPHRFEMLREIEQLINGNTFSSGLMQLLGLADEDAKLEVKFSSHELLNSDPDQMEVLTKLQHQNCMVQGPPGTGKSQVIINLIGKLLELEKSTLVVSEKRVALDVIQKKMTSIGLGGLCYTTTQHFSNSDLVQELHKEWERLELMSTHKSEFSPFSELIQGQLQNTLNLLHQPKLGNGKTIYEFLIDYEQLKSKENTGYSSDLPTLDEWTELKPCFELLFEKNLISLISQVKTELIDKAFLLSIESKIQLWQKAISEISTEDNKLEYQKLYELARKSLHYSKFNSTIFKKYGQKFIENSTLAKKINKLKNELFSLDIALEKSKEENSHWLLFPNKAETSELLARFHNSSFLTRFVHKKSWKKWTRSTFLDPITSLESRKKQLELEDKQRVLLGELNKIGIDTTTELEEIIQLIKSISKEDYQEYQKIQLEERMVLDQKEELFSILLSDFKRYFRFDDSIELISFFNELEAKISHLLEQVDLNIGGSKYLSILTKKYFTAQEMEAAIMNSTWSKLKMDFPQLIDFSWESFYYKMDNLLQQSENERVQFSNFLLNKQKSQFDYFHSLLLASSQKLSALDKEIKQELKAGKRILVKEFSKSRNHLSIRQLMDSPAKKWIQLLKPIWLMNPSRISACFPLEKNLFSFAIFDEASQIPLENSFGALQRSERILIAGDPQQMSPSSYFSTTTESVDLLHQASFYLPSLFLSYHYRSYHPALISFSNKYFYQNRLSTFRDASFKEKPIQFNFIPEGRFDDRTNAIEAKAVVDYISTRLSSTDTLGIVAFSESQLQMIFDLLPMCSKEILQERIDLNQVFFKAVENVQGDECDELIVSFGYGYSEKEGVFAYRFGPINLNTGSKRLNVLFTRARKKITFFASVTYTDFKPSSNESIEILRKWFRKLNEFEDEQIDPHCKIHVKEILKNHQNILAIKTLVSIYKERQWDLDSE